MVTRSDDWENIYLGAGSPDTILLVGFKNTELRHLFGHGYRHGHGRGRGHGPVPRTHFHTCWLVSSGAERFQVCKKGTRYADLAEVEG